MSDNITRKPKGRINSAVQNITKIRGFNGRIVLIIAFISAAIIWQFVIVPLTGVSTAIGTTIITYIPLCLAALFCCSFVKNLGNPIAGILLLFQLGFLIWINSQHIEFLKEGKDIPMEYSLFTNLSLFMIIFQLGVLTVSIMKNIQKNKDSLNTNTSNYSLTLISGFLLSSIISGIGISQIWVILEKLKCDC